MPEAAVPWPATTAPPPDQGARDRITGDLDANLFVEAGAGSGKTTTLVDRVVALVASGAAELCSIAAITFTEKAGAELRDRIRRRLGEAAGSLADPAPRRCRAAMAQVDGAAIGTLHSFAQRLLGEHPIEAGIPPRVEVLDEVTSGVEFERRWTTFRDHLLADPDLERTILLLLACGVRHEAMRAIAVAFEENWDLVAERVPDSAPDPPSALAVLERELVAVDEVCAQRIHCRDPDDRLSRRLDEIADHVARLREADDEVHLLEALADDVWPAAPSFAVGGRGQKANWDLDLDRLRSQVRAAGTGLGRVRSDVACAAALRLGAAIRRFTLQSAEERRRAGRLAFHDLLVMARALLRDPDKGPAVRASLHRRYQRLLLDELQDTDPIQIDLAVRIAAAQPGSSEAGTLPWSQVPVAAGHLFMVGDPKQSIYRFRRADIATFLAAKERFGGAGGTVVQLSANFRTVAPVIDWANHVFARLFAESREVEVPVPFQPGYAALRAVRPPPPTGPAVTVLGRAEHDRGTMADDLRLHEASEVVGTVLRALSEGWSVADTSGPGGWRPARLGDVTILVPSRTSLPFLEDALERAGIPYAAEASSLVYATRAVRDVLMVLRAVDDPTDHMRIVAALRTPLLACGDDDLFRFRVERKGSWSYLASQPATVPHDDPVLVGLAFLRSLHDECRWSSPSQLLDRIARDRRAMELGFAEGRPRDVWRRLRFVMDQARAWTEATGGSLRQYLRWVELQTAEGARVAEAVLPETDDHAVRIMTIHAAKGLEFPIAIVSGLSTVPQGRPAPAEVVFPANGGVGYRLGRQVATEEFVEWKPIDEQMGLEERKRLLYVACTRARDHLVVSLHRKSRAAPARSAARTNAELLVDGMGQTMLDGSEPGAIRPPAPHPDDPETRWAPSLPDPARPESPQPLAVWATARAGAFARSSSPTAVAATALAFDRGTATPVGAEVEPPAEPGLQKRPRELDLPPWLKGRYGTAVGRAVHGVLQTVDLVGGEGLDAAAAAQCEAEAVPDRMEDVLRLAADALASPSVREAAALPHWREVYACTPVGSRLVEGYVDLLYRGHEGLVVVDYKTAATDDPHQLDHRVQQYRLQGASYALAVAAATGETVSRVTFVFLTPSGPIERHLQDLATAVDEVAELVGAHREGTVDQAE